MTITLAAVSAAEQELGTDAFGLLGAANIIAWHAQTFNGTGEGLCLPAVALLSHYALTALDLSVAAVQGTYAREPHWWVQHGSVILDPTRSQFEDGPLDDLVATATAYDAASRHPPGWTTPELVVAEAERAFCYPAAAQLWVEGCLAELAELPLSP